MPSNINTVDIREWVERTHADPQLYLERQATEVLLTAIGQSKTYSNSLYLKGGMLMGIVYHSPRQTADLDFTARFSPCEDIADTLSSELNVELRRAAARLGYAQMVCRVQSIKKQPKKQNFVDARFPALDMKIAYAERGSGQHKRLERGECPDTLEMEISFHEPIYNVEFVTLAPDSEFGVNTYSLIDVIAEKLRAFLQQEVRDRSRRQDIYDIDYLLTNIPLNEEDKSSILEALKSKARARDLEPTLDSFDNPALKERARSRWTTIGLELAELPDFDDSFSRVASFYRSLPW